MSPGRVRSASTPGIRAVEDAVAVASQALLASRTPEGYWWANLTADATLESDYILLQLWLHPPNGSNWNPPQRQLVDKAVRAILRRQATDGGWALYPDGPSDLNATIKAYFALKLAGIPANDERMERAKTTILSLGGLEAANSFVKLNLSLFDLFPRSFCPSVPPEMMLLPGNFIYQMSSWTRAIVVPLSILHALNPRRPVPEGFSLSELSVPGQRRWSWLKDRELLTWRNVFLTLDACVKFWERHGLHSVRRRAILRAEQWMLDRTKYSGGLAAIYPSMMYVIMTLDLLGYGPEHPDRVEAQEQFDALMLETEDELTFQPCFSPVWDTAIATYALGEAGVASGTLRPSGDWLLTKEVRRKGDWAIKRPGVEPSGWYFEFANEFYPDIDDTAMVLLSLRHTGASDRQSRDVCVQRATAWLIAMQSSDGGWAAFDADNNWHPLSDVPFADHNAMLDPTCPDITGRVVEALIQSGVGPEHQAIQRGVAYLLRTQEQDGSWYGRWGVNHVYGTFLALRGLRAAGVDDREAPVLRAGEWLRSIQNADGGWGESPASYDERCFVPAASTPSQTAWAVLGLLAGGDRTSLSVQKGIEHLITTQRGDGTWEESAATGTGFPKVFYLQYHLYRNSFPLLALSSYLKAKREVV